MNKTSKQPTRPGSNLTKLTARLIRSVWLFPVLLLILLILLTSLQISGTSEGVYYKWMYGNNAKDPNLLFGHPQPVRSDEWEVTTQLTIAQKELNYPLVNPNLQGGENMSVVGDAPYKDWSAIFRPDNLAFFILPFNNAFAFKWWILLILTIVGFYFLVLRFFPSKRLFATIMSLAFGASPFFMWWYASGTFSPVCFGLFMMLLGMRIIDKQKISFLKRYPYSYTATLCVIALAYLITAFGLILYPPFQIPVIIAAVLFLLGYLIYKKELHKPFFTKELYKKIGLFVISGLIGVALVLTFIKTRSTIVSTIDNSSYPGSRVIEPGGATYQYLGSSFLMPQLPRTNRGVNYFSNESEDSNFFLFSPFLLIPGFVLLVYDYRKKHKLYWPLLLTQICILIFLANMYVSAFGFIYKALFLDLVPHDRIVLGLGFASFLQLLLFVKLLSSYKLSKLIHLVISSYSLICFVVLILVGLNVRKQYPLFVGHLDVVYILAFVFSLIIYLFLTNRYLLASIVLLILTIGSVYDINPIYRGVGPLYNSKIMNTIDAVSSPKDTWVMLDNGIYESLPEMSNRNSLSGVQLYPNLSLWQQVGGKKYYTTYNRYAHVIFNTSNITLSPTFNSQPIDLLQADEFEVKFGCTSFIEKNVQFALSNNPISYACTKLVTKVSYPAITFYIYKVS